MIGANLESMAEGAARLRRAADDLDGTRSELSSNVFGLPWVGQVAERFVSAFTDVHIGGMDHATRFLREMADKLDAQSREQDEASNSAAGERLWRGGADGIPFARDFRGTEPNDLDEELFELADASYDGEGDLPDGWQALSDDQLAAKGIDPAMLIDPDSGFQARVYEDDAGNIVLAFAGTDMTSIPDWVANLGQGTGFSERQYSQALELATRLKVVYGDDLVITGHSLGGGLASYAALGVGAPAVTYNAAGLHDASLRRLGYSPEEARALVAGGQIRAYRIESDILTNVQERGDISRHLAPDAVGKPLTLPDPTPAPDRPSVRIPGTDIRIGIDPLTTSTHGFDMHGSDALRDAFAGDDWKGSVR